MAKLEDIASILKVDIKSKRKTLTLGTPRAGRKRRPWFDSEENINSTRKNIESQFIDLSSITKGEGNLIDQSYLSTGFINPVYKPLFEKGFINRVSKPVIVNLENLRSNPLKLMLFLARNIQNNIEIITRRLTLTEIIISCEISRNSARTALRFLLKKNFIARVDFQPGVKGWSKYSINKSVYEAYLKTNYNQKDSIDKKLYKKGSINSSIFNNTIINKSHLLSWNEVTVSLLSHIGFTNKHLLQLKSKHTPALVQDSINHFAFGLKHSKKTQKYEDPLSVFMGVLRKGEMWIEQNYKSIEEINLEKILHIKKVEIERTNKLEEDLFKLEFTKWRSSLTEDNLLGLAPETNFLDIPKRIRKTLRRRKALELSRDYFFTEVWGKIRQRITNDISKGEVEI